MYPCLLIYYLQQPGNRNNLDAQQHMKIKYVNIHNGMLFTLKNKSCICAKIDGT